MRAPSLVLVAAALWGACGRDPELKASSTTTSCKPEPPVEVEAIATQVGPERYELTVVATPTKDVAWIDLAIAGGTGKGSYGPTARGVKRVVSTIVEVRDRTTEVWASARVEVDGIEMAKTAMVTLGEPRPQPKTRVYATPGGELAREVRR